MVHVYIYTPYTEHILRGWFSTHPFDPLVFYRVARGSIHSPPGHRHCAKPCAEPPHHSHRSRCFFFTVPPLRHFFDLFVAQMPNFPSWLGICNFQKKCDQNREGNECFELVHPFCRDSPVDFDNCFYTNKIAHIFQTPFFCPCLIKTANHLSKCTKQSA